MKIIIEESRLEKFMVEYFYRLFDVAEMNWRHPWEYDMETNKEYKDQTRTVFFHGSEFDDDVVFRYYNKGYFNDIEANENSHILSVEDEYKTVLDGYFGTMWHEPIKKWFEENFGMYVKTVDYL
jgi:hypothetical protein